ncbi:E3 ubiquitin/ISG15 ligase TRIM25-like [Hyperolius riggenbachi]|uniref:E3 ubiquitin/ISG15 ligase TRIM25-like n=1 Tax=Hyperolius riggenbachi TaxID=752182 RepID=UPI0035A38DA2
MASAGLREELECSICLSIYTDPVTLRCGHNFCQGCIHRVLDTQEGSGGYVCPECRKKFQERPSLQRNINLCNIVESFLSTKPGQKPVISCSQCFHALVPAVKSCLHCEVSLCENHLRVHKKSPEHVLCDPTTSLEDRKCSIHKDKLLEYYCNQDAACVCVSCYVIGEHVGHKMVSLPEASESRKNKLRNVLQEVMTEREEMEKRVQSLEELRKSAQEKTDGETEKVTVVFKDLNRCLEDLEKKVLSNINRQAEQVSLHYDDVLRQLEIKKEELSGRCVTLRSCVT